MGKANLLGCQARQMRIDINFAMATFMHMRPAKKRVDISGGNDFAQDAFSALSSGLFPVSDKPVEMPKATPVSPQKGSVRIEVRREKSGRAGKIVTTVKGIPDAQVGDVLKSLKQSCATGGTLKDGQIELQGDFCSKAMDWLNAQPAYKAVRCGG